MTNKNKSLKWDFPYQLIIISIAIIILFGIIIDQQNGPNLETTENGYRIESAITMPLLKTTNTYSVGSDIDPGFYQISVNQKIKNNLTLKVNYPEKYHDDLQLLGVENKKLISDISDTMIDTNYELNQANTIIDSLYLPYGSEITIVGETNITNDLFKQDEQITKYNPDMRGIFKINQQEI